jgi:hypothetical protein
MTQRAANITTFPPFTFISGVKKPIKVVYCSFNPSSKNAALIPTCYAGHINEALNFAFGALKDYHVIVVAMLGNGEPSAPSNDPDFPSDYSLRIRLYKFSVPVGPGAFGVSRVRMLLLDLVWVGGRFIIGL